MIATGTEERHAPVERGRGREADVVWHVEVMEMKPTPAGLRATGRWRRLGEGWKKLESKEEAETLAACFAPPTRVVEAGSSKEPPDSAAVDAL